MADKTYTLEIIAKGLKEVTRGMEQLAAEGAKVEGAQAKASTANKKHTRSQHERIKADKGASQSTNNSTKAFSKMAQGMEGTLVPAYAAVAANVFALTAAFGALSRAADLQILINASEELAVTTGRNLYTVAESMKALTGEAVSLKEAMVNASLAASAGFDNTTIEKLTTVAKNASVALGRDMGDALNRIFKGAIKAEPELLDELGIIVRLDKASRDYAATLGKNVKTLTTFEKQTAVVNAVLAEGEKKFSAIQDVDVNPYAQLAASFSDVAISLTNLIAVPIVPVIQFLAENIESLAAVLVIFGASILKTAFPALNKFSEVIDQKLLGAVSSLEAGMERLNRFKLSLLPQTEVQKVAASGTKLKAEFQAIADKYVALGKPIPAGVTKTLNAITGSAQQATAAMKSLNATAQNIAGGKGSVIGLDAGDITRIVGTVDTLETGISKLEDTTRTSTVKVATGFAGIGVKIANAGLAVTQFGINVVQSSFKSIAAVSAEASAWGALKQVITQTKLAATQNVGAASKVFGSIGAFAGGAGAALFKMIPIIGSLTIAWQILSGVFSFIKGLFFEEDIIKLTESLDKQNKALKSSAKSVKFFEKSLANLPSTLSNVNKQLTLQSNILIELFTNLDEVVNDIDLSDGFSTWENFLDVFALGNLDEFKDQLVTLSDQLRGLGYVEEVTAILDDYGKVTRLSAKDTRELGKELRELTKDFRDNAQGAKEAFAQISDGVDALNKSVTKLVDGLPQLNALEETFLGIDTTLAQLDVGNPILLVSTLQELSGFALEEFGLTNIIDEATPATLAIETLTAQLDELNKKQAEYDSSLIKGGEIGEKSKENTILINSTILTIDRLEKSLESLAESAVIQLEAVSAEFKKINNAQRAFIDASNKVKFELALPNNSLIERFELTKKLAELERKRLSDVGGRTESSLENANKSLTRQKDLVDEVASSLRGLGEETDENANERNRLTKELGRLEADYFTTASLRAQLQSKLDSDRGKAVVTYQKSVELAEKELNKIYALQIQGAKGLGESAAYFEGEYIAAVAAIAQAIDKNLKAEDASFLAEEILLAKQDVESFKKFLEDTKIGSFEASVTRAKADTTGTEDINFELETNEKLNGLLDERLDKEQLIATARIDAQIEALENNTIGQMQDTIAIENARILSQLHAEKNAIAAKGVAIQAKGLKDALKAAKLEKANVKAILALGASANKHNLDSLKIDQKVRDAKLDTFKAQQKLRKELEETAKITRLIEFNESIAEGAENMNNLADAMSRFNSNAADGFDPIANSALLLQETLSNMEGSFAQFGKGMATISLAVTQYGQQMKAANTEQEENQALMGLAMNAAGAMAGAFEDGSTAAKIFTTVQQGLAIASAAVAVLQQGQGDPYSAFARIAAMLSLVASVMGAFGISGGGGASGAAAPTAQEAYRENVGSQGLVGRDLRSNTLVDGIDELVGINTMMYGATRDLEVTMSKMEQTFNFLAGQLANTFGTRGVTGFSRTGETVTDVTSDFNQAIITGVATLISPIVDLFTLGFGGDFIDDITGGLFSNSTTVTRALIDAGLQFDLALESAGDSIIGSLEAYAFTVTEVTSRTSHTLHSDSVSRWIEDELHGLSGELQTAFGDAFVDILNGVSLLVTEFASNAAGIDLAVLFSGISSLDAGPRLSLVQDNGDPLSEEGTAEAIAAYFSALTADIAESIFPFLSTFRQAGEELGDTLIRLTTESIAINNALSTIGTSISSYTDNIIISSSAINERIAAGLVISNADAAEIEAYMAAQQAGTTRGGILGAIMRVVTKTMFTEFDDPATYAEIRAAVFQAAEAFKVEAVAAWDTALLTHFKDIEEFGEIFNIFASTIFDESELATFAIANATTSLESGFDDLIQQALDMGRTDLASILQAGITPENLRAFYELANATGAFGVEADFATGIINTAGADLLATAVEMGPAFEALADNTDILDALLEKIEDLNNSYIEQIALFGQLEKDNALLNLAFDYRDALEEAEETGSSLELVEIAYGLRRLEIVKDSYEAIESEIKDSMDSIFSSLVDVSSNLSIWDDIAFSTIKINKLVDRLKKGTTSLNLDSLIGDTTEFTEFISNFGNIIEGLSAEGPTSISDEIALVDQLRSEIINKYELESALLEAQVDLFQNLSQEINNFLDDLIISDLSPLTNFERLGEATSQFLDNAANVFSTDETTAENAANNLLDSASSLLDIASLFYAIGPEYVKVFDLVTSTLGGIDTALLAELSTSDPLVDLTTDVVDKLNVLDDILLELQASNEATYFSDIAQAVTDGMIPVMQNVTDKLTAIDDGSWTTMIGILSSINTALGGNLIPIDAGALSSVVNDLTGDISSFAVGTPNVPNDMVASVHRGEAIVPESMAEGIRKGELTLGQQDNSDIVNAIRELTGILAISQEDLVDISNRNADISREIADNINQQQSTVKTAGVL